METEKKEKRLRRKWISKRNRAMEKAMAVKESITSSISLNS